LVTAPDIIVLDEATAALDPESHPSETTLISVRHRPELDPFHDRKVVLERRRGETQLVNSSGTEIRSTGVACTLVAMLDGQKTDLSTTKELSHCL
jgi:hypothetical protein